MVTPADLPDLHDAILRSIEIDWERGRARCTLDVWIGRPTADPAAEKRPVVITLSGLKEATIPRAEPWGAKHLRQLRRTHQRGWVSELVDGNAKRG